MNQDGLLLSEYNEQGTLPPRPDNITAQILRPSMPACRNPLQLLAIVGIYFIIGATIIFLYQPTSQVPGVRPLWKN